LARDLSNWIESYQDYSQFSEAPDSFHFWTSVAAIAGALRRHVWIDMGYFQWTPNFYIVFVAPPGIVSKSTTANIGMNLLREVPGIHFGPDAVTWQSLIQSLGSSGEAFEYQNQMHTMSSITIVSSEFGTFLNPNDREMVDVLVSLWDGQIGVWEKRTKTQGDDAITNPWINLIACTTPAWIQGNFPEYMIGGGFTSRTIFVYAEEKRRLEAYPKDKLPKDHLLKRAGLIHDLEHIATTLIGEYKLSKAATAWGVDWYEKLYERNKDDLTSDRFAGYIARKQTHLHKVAMVLCAAERDTMVLEPGDLMAAEGHLLASEDAQDRVFSRIVAPEARPSNALLDVVRRARRIEKSALYTKLFTQMTAEQFKTAIDSCIQANLAKVINNDGKIYVVYTGKETAPQKNLDADTG